MFIKKRGPLILISGGGGGPLPVGSFLSEKISAKNKTSDFS